MNQDTPQSQPEDALSGRKKSRRSVKNIALKPLLQMKIGLYAIIFSIILVIAIGAIIHFNLMQSFQMILDLTGAEDETKQLLIDHLAPVQSQVALACIVYVLATLMMSLAYTHKMVGPTVAFSRHVHKIIEGDLAYRTNLRDGDAFEELGKALNDLSVHLESKSKK